MISDNPIQKTATRPSQKAALIALLVAILAIFAFPYLSAWMGPAQTQRQYNLIVLFSILYQAVALALPAFYYYYRHPAAMPAMRVRRMDPLCALLVLPCALIGILALNMVTNYWLALLEVLGMTATVNEALIPRSTQALGMMLLMATIAPALFEEFLFRGFLLPALEPMGQRRAVLLSGLLFALLHARLEGLPALLAIGILLGALTIATGSLLAPMLYHAAHNGFTLVIAYFIAQQTPQEATQQIAASPASLLSNLPMTLALVGVWVLLLLSLFSRAKKKRKEEDSVAVPRQPMRPGVRALLAFCFLLLLGMQVLSALLLAGVTV